MSRLECLGKSTTASQKQLAVEVQSAHAEKHKLSDKMGKKTVTDKTRRSLLAQALPPSVQVPCKETQKSGFPSGEMLNTDKCSPKESINITPRVKEQAAETAVPDEKVKMKDLMKAQPLDSAVTGGTMHAPSAVEPLPTQEVNEEKEQIEEEYVEKEELKAPVELIIEFLGAVMDRNFQLASKLCQMILMYEPDNPEASEFLPLIQKKLLEEQEAEQSSEEDEEEEDDDDDDDDDAAADSGSDEDTSQSSSCSSSSCSSSSASDDDEEEEKRVNRHKPCPPSHIYP